MNKVGNKQVVPFFPFFAEEAEPAVFSVHVRGKWLRQSDRTTNRQTRSTHRRNLPEEKSQIEFEMGK